MLTSDGKARLGIKSTMPQVKREIVEVMWPLLVEGIEGRVADQMVDILVPLVMEEIAAVAQEEELVSQERVQQPTVEYAPVPQFLGETIEVVLAPTARVQRRTDDVPMPQVLEETVEVVRFARVSDCNKGRSCQCLRSWRRQSRYLNFGRRPSRR